MNRLAGQGTSPVPCEVGWAWGTLGAGGQAVEGAYRQQVEAIRQDMLLAQGEQRKQLR